MVTTNTSDSEFYNYGVERSWVADGAITIIRTEGNMSRDGINTWASLLTLTLQEWPSEHPLAILHDLTHPNQGLTPFARERTLDVLRHRPKDMTVYNAIVLPDTFMRHIIDMFLRTPAFKHERLELRIFGCEEQAIRWLEDQLAQHHP